jgi:Zn-dependent protease
LRRPVRAPIWSWLIWALVLKFAIGAPEHAYSEAMKEMARVGISINGVLMILNLLPLPPLDGGRIVVSLLPHRAAWKFAQLERWGIPHPAGLALPRVAGYHPAPS